MSSQGRTRPRRHAEDGVQRKQQPPLSEDGLRLKEKYNSSIGSLTELFPDWLEEDLLLLIDEAQGDIEVVAAKIAEGHVSQWDEVKKKTKKKAEPKRIESRKPRRPFESNANTAPATSHSKPRAAPKAPSASTQSATPIVTSKPPAAPAEPATTSNAPTQPETRETTATANGATSSSTNGFSYADAANSRKPPTGPAFHQSSNPDAPSHGQSHPKSDKGPRRPKSQNTKASSSSQSSQKPKQAKPAGPPPVTWASIATPKAKEPEPKKAAAPSVAPSKADDKTTSSENSGLSAATEPTTASDIPVTKTSGEPLQSSIEVDQQSSAPTQVEVPVAPAAVSSSEPVVLPGSVRSIDSIGVQFGSLDINGHADVEPEQEYVQQQPQQQQQASVPQQQKIKSSANGSQQVPQQAPQQLQAQAQAQGQAQGQAQSQAQQNQYYYSRYGAAQQQPTGSYNQQNYMYPGFSQGAPAGYSDFQYGSNDRNYNYYYENQQNHAQGGQAQVGQAQVQPQGIAQIQASIAATSGATAPSPNGQTGAVPAGVAGATGAAVPGQSPAANQNYAAVNPYYMSPAYAAYYYQNYGYNPQAAAAAVAAQQYGAAPQKGYYNQQQSYYDNYGRANQSPAGQHQSLQNQNQSQAQAQQQQQPTGGQSAGGAAVANPTSAAGIQGQAQQLDFLEKQQPGSPSGYPQQQNLYAYAGYGQYGGQQQRQGGWGYGNQ